LAGAKIRPLAHDMGETSRMSSSPLPPGPRSSIPLLYAYFTNPVECGARMAKTWGDTHTLPGNPPLVMTGDPAGIKAIYSADPDSFVPANQDMADLIGRHSMLLIHGAEHRAARKLMMPAFHGARMRAYGELMVRLTEQHTAAWRPGAKVNMLETAQAISLDVILQAVFGVRDPERMKALGAVILETVNGISPIVAAFQSLRRNFGGWGPWAAHQERMRRLHDQFGIAIATARQSETREDILAMLLHARDEHGQAMPDDEIEEHLLTLIFAGHETTAIAISWAIYALHRPENAAVLSKLRAALQELPPDATPDVVAKQPYLDAVCHETLRRYPLAPAPSPRKLVKPLELCGFTLPVGTNVAASIGMVHFNESLYPEPMTFRPERFLDRSFGPFEFIPFGGGARRCLGAALAAYEMRLVVATLIQRFALRLASNKPDKGTVRAANASPKSGIPLWVDEVGV
jgi:cytochrome P450